MNSYITSPRSVTLAPIARPSRILNWAMAFFERVTTAFWPAMAVRSFSACWIFLESEAASPAPIFSTTLLIFGTCIALV